MAMTSEKHLVQPTKANIAKYLPSVQHRANRLVLFFTLHYDPVFTSWITCSECGVVLSPHPRVVGVSFHKEPVDYTHAPYRAAIVECESCSNQWELLL